MNEFSYIRGHIRDYIRLYIRDYRREIYNLYITNMNIINFFNLEVAILIRRHINIMNL